MESEKSLIPIITSATDAIINQVNAIAIAKFGLEDTSGAALLLMRQIVINVVGNFIFYFTQHEVDGALDKNVKIIHDEIDMWANQARKLEDKKKEKMQ